MKKLKFLRQKYKKFNKYNINSSKRLFLKVWLQF